MFIVGFSGGPRYSELDDDFSSLSPLRFHDAAAAVVRDGQPIFAVEEERLSRQKHTNRFPALAIRASIHEAGCSLSDIETFAFCFSETFVDPDLAKHAAILGIEKKEGVRDILTRNISRALDASIDRQKIEFVRHHHAHAAATYFASGFTEALIFVVDGNGERESLSIFRGINGEIEEVHRYSVGGSLGHFYRYATQLLGFSNFGEYKVMGLAPYGESDLYFRFVSMLYKFNPDGSYDLNIARLGDLAYDLGIVGRAEPPTRKWERKIHFAAAVQQLLEVVVIDILSWWQAKLDLKNLCLSGEVAQNCVLNGVIASTKKFENIFVHPASHDAGAALGAAIYIGKQRPSSLYNVMNGVIANTKEFENVFVHSASHDAGAPLGSEIYIGKQRTPAHDAPAVSYSPLLGPKLPQNDDIRREIKTWEGGLHIVECDDVFKAAAEKLAEGKIVGWARGRSEFGPSALGNRSILGDPRPRQNWQGINLAIKQRESFRPFGSAVLAEDFNDYFIPLPSNPNMEHMVFVTKVREEKRAELGAVTHVNGTACVQVVTKSANPDFWKLISAFKERTGCPVLLNTSFNNRYEPIVQNVTDAVRTFLTTGLDYLFIENTMAEKSSQVRSLIATASLRLSDAAWVEEITTVRQRRTVLRRAPSYTRELNNWQLARYLCEFGSEFSLVAHLVDGVSPKDRDQLIEEIFLLWQERFIDVRPMKVARQGGPIGADLSF